MCKCMSTTVCVNGTVQFYFLLDQEIQHYYYHGLRFTYSNNCNLFFSSLKPENGLKKQVQNVTRIKHGFVELVVILCTVNTFT